VIKERSEVSARELEEALGYPINDVRYYLRQLKAAGRIETTNPHTRTRNQRYRPTARGDVAG
jgi:predicted transcriptional regulator